MNVDNASSSIVDHLIDTEVVEIKLYGGIEVVFGEERDSALQIECDFLIVRGNSTKKVHFAPAYGDESSGLDDLASTFRQTVIASVANEDGDLTLDFSNSVRLIVEHDDNFEAWNLSSHSRGIIISLPGGGLG